jgi:hypothetical protein
MTNTLPIAIGMNDEVNKKEEPITIRYSTFLVPCSLLNFLNTAMQDKKY